jgi:transcription initiation factor TFIIIB Brf1 subunit/transcription initiation factor TFIIB
LNLKDACINKAYELYKQINANNDLRGRTVDSRVATVIFMASRLVDQSKPIEKILQFTECTKQELSRTYKKVKELFPEQTQARMMASKVAESCCNTLKLPMDIVQACKQTADNLQSLSAMEGKRPQTVAGVAIMMVI